MASPKKETMLNRLKLMTMGLVVSGNAMGTPAQNGNNDDDNQKPKTEVIQTPDKEIHITDADLADKYDYKEPTGKTSKFSKIEELPPGLFPKKVEYVMSVEDWNKNGTVNIKRANREQIECHDLTTVMQCREGNNNGDVVNASPGNKRLFIFQSFPSPLGRDLVAYMYCSKDKDLHDFAAKYIPNTPQNKALMVKVQEALYDENGNLKTGKAAELQRQKALKDLGKITVSGIGAPTKFSTNFVNNFKAFSKNHYNEVMNAEREFAVAMYPLYSGTTNKMAKNARKSAARKGCRDASCLPLGETGLYLSSSIAHGCNSEAVLKESKVLNKAKKVNECDYITVEAARQLALAGIDGADDMYKSFLNEVDKDKQHVAEVVRKITTLDLTQKTDAVKDHKKDAEMQMQLDNSEHPHKTFDLQLFLQQHKGNSK